MDRKQFLSRSLKVGIGALVAGPLLVQAGACNTPEEKGAESADTPKPLAGPPLLMVQDPLLYSFDALEPHIDARTMEIHYTKHHAAYVKNIMEAVAEEGITAADDVAFFAGVGLGSTEKFMEVYSEAAMKRFGSGWAWLVEKDGKLEIGSTPNQDNPYMDVSDFKGKPLLALDVWEHAYYLKYQNKRNDYVAAWWNLVNWDTVAQRLG